MHCDPAGIRPIAGLIATCPSTLRQAEQHRAFLLFRLSVTPVSSQVPGALLSWSLFPSVSDPVPDTHYATTMAVGDNPSSPQHAAPPHPIDIEAWTEQATVALSSVTISAPADVAQGATVTLAIPLDEHDAHARPALAAAAKEGGYYRRKEPLRRDSMKRREALLKGKEGSRRRQRWENGTLGIAPPLLSETLCASPYPYC